VHSELSLRWTRRRCWRHSMLTPAQDAAAPTNEQHYYCNYHNLRWTKLSCTKLVQNCTCDTVNYIRLIKLHKPTRNWNQERILMVAITLTFHQRTFVPSGSLLLSSRNQIRAECRSISSTTACLLVCKRSLVCPEYTDLPTNSTTNIKPSTSQVSSRLQKSRRTCTGRLLTNSSSAHQ